MTHFADDPIVRTNQVVAIVRSWYEDHREHFIHDLVHKVLSVNAEANPPVKPAPVPQPEMHTNAKVAAKPHKKTRR